MFMLSSMVLTSLSLNFLFPHGNSPPPPGRAGQREHLASCACLGWVATLSFPKQILGDKTPSRYYSSANNL